MAESELSLDPFEVQFRSQHGIPKETKRVLILAESSHWDPNWLLTSEEYYQRYVEANLLQAVAELEKEPRRVYSVEGMFFLRMFWDRHPELQETVRQLVKEGRLCLTSTGVSSADTLLPMPEAILRDLILGQEWLRSNGLDTEPQLAYFPDCFGHTPALPTLLNSAGFTMTAFARLDGMHGMGSDYDPKSSYPRPGSNAAVLLQKEKTLDFIWRSVDGSQVLTHWNAFSYFQGDMITYRGLLRAYLFPSFFYSEDRSDARVSSRIQEYVDQLAPLSRTPYLFCPIGMDFNPPILALLALLDRYNERHYPTTGTWVVNAKLADYLALVNCYQDRLPVLGLDPNPYWTGFYTSRPALKQRCHILVKDLLKAEKLSVITGQPQAAALDQKVIHDAWWAVSTAIHHDYITGTSPDAVTYGEQIPMLDTAIQSIRPLVDRLTEQVVAESDSPGNETTHEGVTWEREGDLIRVRTPHYGLELSEAEGGCISRLWEAASKKECLEGLSNEVVDYSESGGLWRMGMEYRGGKFKIAQRSANQRVQLGIHPHPQALEVDGQIILAGSTYQLAILFRADSPLIRFRLTGRAPEGHTVCARFRTGLDAKQLTMENPGGVAVRPVQKIYTPTFWPVQRFCHVQDSMSQEGMAFLFALPGSAAYSQEERALELVALRNATREKAYGFIPILACPASGHEREVTTFEYALFVTGAGGWQENCLPQLARAYERDPWVRDERASLSEFLENSVQISSENVWLDTMKPAWRGEGVVARLISYTFPEKPVRVGIRGLRIQSATECDLRERDLRPVQVQDGQVTLQLTKTITSLRIILES